MQTNKKEKFITINDIVQELRRRAECALNAADNVDNFRGKLTYKHHADAIHHRNEYNKLANDILEAYNYEMEEMRRVHFEVCDNSIHTYTEIIKRKDAIIKILKEELIKSIRQNLCCPRFPKCGKCLTKCGRSKKLEQLVNNIEKESMEGRLC